MTRGQTRGWCLIHKWTSLACTIFLLMLCTTGLPLIFHDEIDALTGRAPAPGQGRASAAEGPGLLPLDALLARALGRRPGQVPLFMAFSDDTPIVTVTTGPTADAPTALMTLQLFDRTSGRIVGARADEGGGVMAFLLKLHTDMFLGLAGMLFLGAMGLLFVVSLISGAVVYAPFMRKLDFGTLRTGRRARVRWLDRHNLLGIVALAWMAVVGLTGVVNTLATPIMRLWQARELADMTRAYAGRPPLPPARYGSLDLAMRRARAALPGKTPQFVAFPGGTFSSGHHYAIFFKGATPLTERLLTPALVDAENGRLTDVRMLPWYAQALLLSQPLHFGDYGGLPLKLLWAVLDLFAIVVLGSGIYLWLRPRRASTGRCVPPGDAAIA